MGVWTVELNHTSHKMLSNTFSFIEIANHGMMHLKAETRLTKGHDMILSNNRLANYRKHVPVKQSCKMFCTDRVKSPVLVRFYFSLINTSGVT